VSRLLHLKQKQLISLQFDFKQALTDNPKKLKKAAEIVMKNPESKCSYHILVYITKTFIRVKDPFLEHRRRTTSNIEII